MNDSDLTSEDTDWIYSRKKLQELKKLRNPLDESHEISDIEKHAKPNTALERKDPVFNELSTQSKHEMIQSALEEKTSLALKKSDISPDKRLQREGANTVKKMSENKATSEDLRKALHSYDPLCNCNQCNFHF